MAGQGAWEPPEQFDEYRLIRPLGQGGMGRVFLAHDTLLDRPVAIKFLAGLNPAPHTRQRFFVEARAVARLQHPNVVAIHRVGEVAGQPYLVSELVRGTPLDDLPRPVRWQQALDIGIGLARGLAAAHRRGVLHRDIKPANAMLTEDGEAKLLDFGVAKLFAAGDGPLAEAAAADQAGVTLVPGAAPAADSGEGASGAGAVVDVVAATEAQSSSPADAVLARQQTTALLADRLVAAAAAEPGGAAAAVEERQTAAVPVSWVAGLPPPSGSRSQAIEVLCTTPSASPRAAAPASPPTVPSASPVSSWSTPSSLPGGMATSPVLTAAGAAVGTPRYMAPEIWRGQGANQRSDIYSLGAVLYELCAGRPPCVGNTLEELRRLVTTTDVQPLSEAVGGVDQRFAQVVDRCLARDATVRFASGDQLREALEQLAVPLRGGAIPEGNPYRGLSAFGAEHRALFFGRGPEIRAILDRLRADQFVLVAGDSGVGKSSVCRAGVVPAAADGALGPLTGGAPAPLPAPQPETASRDARALPATPNPESSLAFASAASAVAAVTLVPGRRPLASLAAALAPLLATDEAKVAIRLRREPRRVARALRRQALRTPAPPAAAGVLIFVDQMEELLTAGDPAEAAASAEALSMLLLHNSRVRLLATARSDFLTRLSALPGLGDQISRALFLLPPLSDAGLREAIVGPAGVKGLAFESDEQVAALAAAAGRAAGGLPLLQFTLAELWEARDQGRRLIPAAALARLGGVEGALTRHADGVLAALLPAERQAARRILSRLVTAEGTRARRPEAELCAVAVGAPRRQADDPAARAALEALVRGRLLTACEDEEGASGAYEIAHEALLLGWDTLRGWLTADAGFRITRQRLERAVAEWERLERSAAALWGRLQLRDVEGVDLSGLGEPEAAFVAASRRAVQRRRRVRLSIAIAVPLLLALAYVGVRARARWEVERTVARHLRQATTLLSQARQGNAEVEERRRRAFAAFDRGAREEGETEWTQVLSESARVDQGYSRASTTLESALSLDPGRGDVRALFADVTLERALLAERDHRPGQRDELVERLRAYDDGGTRQQVVQAPARVLLEIDPAGASVETEVETEVATVATGPMVGAEGGVAAGVEGGPTRGRDGQRPWSRRRLLGRAPLPELSLPPGSHTLVLRAADRLETRLPLLLHRGEQTRVRVRLPRADRVPRGFIHVPAGRFLFGCAEPENVRRNFFFAQPLHEVESGEYLIARHEVTYADWIEFLRSLPAEECARRRPHAGRGGSIVDLRELADGQWQLTLRPTTQAYTARMGEPIRYLDRDRRQVQDWLRLPVAGISFEDVVASQLNACGLGYCVSSTRSMFRICSGTKPCTHTSADRLASVDDACSTTCKAATFTCPASGRYLVMKAPYYSNKTLPTMMVEPSVGRTPGYTLGGTGLGGGTFEATAVGRVEKDVSADGKRPDLVAVTPSPVLIRVQAVCADTVDPYRFYYLPQVDVSGAVADLCDASPGVSVPTLTTADRACLDAKGGVNSDGRWALSFGRLWDANGALVETVNGVSGDRTSITLACNTGTLAKCETLAKYTYWTIPWSAGTLEVNDGGWPRRMKDAHTACGQWMFPAAYCGLGTTSLASLPVTHTAGGSFTVNGTTINHADDFSPLVNSLDPAYTEAAGYFFESAYNKYRPVCLSKVRWDRYCNQILAVCPSHITVGVTCSTEGTLFDPGVNTEHRMGPPRVCNSFGEAKEVARGWRDAGWDEPDPRIYNYSANN